MNRRNAVLAVVSSALIPAGLSTAAEPSEQMVVMADLIYDVIALGDMSDLEHIVTPNVTIAVLGVSDIDAFREVSVEGYESRDAQYESAKFDIESIAENENWCHALVRFEGKKVNGKMEARSLFYVAQFQDVLIHRLYLS